MLPARLEDLGPPHEPWLLALGELEDAGGAVEEFHTDAPDWEALIQEHLGQMEKSR